MSAQCAAFGTTPLRAWTFNGNKKHCAISERSRQGVGQFEHRRAISVLAVAGAPSKEPCTNSTKRDVCLKYKRVMLKVSGEALAGTCGFGIDPATLTSIAVEVAAASQLGLEIAIVVGGGNFFRGVNRWDGLDRCTADYVGMLATVMNAICLQSALEGLGVDTRVQTAIEMREIAEPYIRRRAVRHLERGRVVIFGGGTGNPFFTTDTAAALRAAEIGADAFLKATKVDGVYDSDPVCNPGAKLQRHLSYREVMLRELAVMDETAITLCKENDIHVVVCHLHDVAGALRGEPEVGTSIDAGAGGDLLRNNKAFGKPAEQHCSADIHQVITNS